jgi:hypothetical protein
VSGSGVQRELTRNRKVDAAIKNEFITRRRVDELEVRTGELEAYVHFRFNGSLTSRLRWLFLGR